MCAVMDLYSRKIIAYKLSDKINTQLAVDTVDLAVANRGKSNGIIFHTDRGSQYTSKEFRKHLDNLNMIQSALSKILCKSKTKQAKGRLARASIIWDFLLLQYSRRVKRYARRRRECRFTLREKY